MQIFKYITALYIFLALILLGLASAVAISFEDYARYAYSTAILIHSITILYFFIQDYLEKKTKEAKQ